MSKPAAAVRLKPPRQTRRSTLPEQAAARPTVRPQAASSRSSRSAPFRLALGAILLIAGLWSYWPTFESLAHAWASVADYSHGFFVVPLGIAFLWVRRDHYPGLATTAPWACLALLAISLAVRHVGDAFFFVFLDGWSLVPWTAACVALLGGWPLLRWSWTAILFLTFMVPLPFSLESALSGPLQQVATAVSTAVLQFLGQPAFADGNVILLGDERLEVAQACSGLRLFVGIFALTYAYVALISRPAWEKLLLVSAAAPIAVAANAARIVVTGMLYQWLPGEQARDRIHDAAGWGMVLFAAAAFWLLLIYLRQLVKEELVMDMTALVKHSRS